MDMKSTRSYSMTLRAERAEMTREQIVEAARALIASHTAGFTLEQVAERAGVSVRTIMRIFGSKDALYLATIGTSRSPRTSPAAGFDVSDAPVTVLFDDYEEIGMRVIALLGEEHRSPEIAEVLAAGRADHRGWVESTWSAQLKTYRGAKRRQVVLALFAATDVYLWKLLRIDLGLDRDQAEAVVRRLVVGALTQTKEQ
jgi:AcrR family transcriptional regulator